METAAALAAYFISHAEGPRRHSRSCLIPRPGPRGELGDGVRKIRGKKYDDNDRGYFLSVMSWIPKREDQQESIEYSDRLWNPLLFRPPTPPSRHRVLDNSAIFCSFSQNLPPLVLKGGDNICVPLSRFQNLIVKYGILIDCNCYCWNTYSIAMSSDTHSAYWEIFCHLDWQHCTLVVYPFTCLPPMFQVPLVSSSSYMWRWSSENMDKISAKCITRVWTVSEWNCYSTETA